MEKQHQLETEKLKHENEISRLKVKQVKHLESAKNKLENDQKIKEDQQYK